MNVAFEEFSAYRFRHGHAALSEALRIEPQLLAAHWLRFQYPLDPAPLRPADAEEFRQRWAQGLAAFEALDFRHPQLQPQIWGCVGSTTAFYRHYLGDCVAEQKRYGALLHRMMAALDSGERPAPPPRARRRVLFCSPYFYQHTVGRLFLPLIEALDRERFEVHGLHFGPEDDELTARAAALEHFHRGNKSAPEWRHLISDLQPDVVVYLDLGMHPLPQALACLRLAPVQAVMWGHPVTTGIPTLDFVLSPDAMEPEGAEVHYSERLIRLPGMGHGLELEVEATSPTAASGSGSTLKLLCAQSIYKLMPEQDRLFARILAALPDAELHFIPHPEAEVREQLKQRIAGSMAELGIDAIERVVLHGYRSLDEFKALVSSCDIALDSIGWSGGMSSLDVLSCGVPTVTLEGDVMRGRQTAALLRAAGVEELIVADEPAYLAKVLQLAESAILRQQLGQRLRQGMPRQNCRAEVSAALSDFLQQPPAA